MKIKIKNIYFTIEELFVIFIFVLILSPIARKYFDGYLICYSFIFFHECAHMLVAGIFGDKILQVNIRLCGMNAVIKIKNELHPRWLLIYLVGPLSNVFLATLFYNVEMVRDINLGLAIINLLPIYPLDGFNALKILLSWKFSKYRVESILKKIQKLVLIGIWIIGIGVLAIFKNASIIIFCLYVIFFIKWEK